MTVQELIDELLKVEDKSKQVQVYSERANNDADYVKECDDSVFIF